MKESRFLPDQKRELIGRVKSCRKRLLMTRKDFAKVIGVSADTVRCLEGGTKKEPDYRTVKKFLAFEKASARGVQPWRENVA